MSLQVSVKSYKALQITEQQAKKNRTGRVTWGYITKNKKYLTLFSQNNLISNHQEHIKRIKQAFRKAFKQISVTMVDKNGVNVLRYVYDSQKDEFVRRNEYEQIKSQQTLFKFIEGNPKGVLVSDQLLQYTYRDVQKDIQKLISDKKIKRINSSNKMKKDYYVFSNDVEKQYQLSDSYEHFGKEDYLQLCKNNYKNYQTINQDQTLTTSNAMFLPSSQRFNQWVPGYAQMKKQWLLRNQEKQRQKSKA